MTRPLVDEGILEDAIRQAREAGLLLNCEDAEDGPFWTSDVPEARAFAARLCHGCPIFDPCRDEGRRHKFGTWGGVDRTRAGWDA